MGFRVQGFRVHRVHEVLAARRDPEPDELMNL